MLLLLLTTKQASLYQESFVLNKKDSQYITLSPFEPLGMTDQVSPAPKYFILAIFPFGVRLGSKK